MNCVIDKNIADVAANRNDDDDTLDVNIDLFPSTALPIVFHPLYYSPLPMHISCLWSNFFLKNN